MYTRAHKSLVLFLRQSLFLQIITDHIYFWKLVQILDTSAKQRGRPGPTTIPIYHRALINLLIEIVLCSVFVLTLDFDRIITFVFSYNVGELGCCGCVLLRSDYGIA